MNLQRIHKNYILGTYFGSTLLAIVGICLVPAVLGHVLFWAGMAGLVVAAIAMKFRRNIL
jgi:hypothetical protein